MYKHILISTDGSEVAQKGVDHGLSLAKSLAARVTVITVTEPFPYYAAASSAGWAPLPIDISGYEEGQKDLAVEASILYVPNSRPAEAIVETARTQGCSLIVMSSHGRRGLGRMLLGSQTAEVLAHSPVPVLVVR